MNEFSKTSSFENVLDITISFEKIWKIIDFDYCFQKNENECENIERKRNIDWKRSHRVEILFEHDLNFEECCDFEDDKDVRVVKRKKSHASDVLRIFEIEFMNENSIDLNEKKR